MKRIVVAVVLFVVAAIGFHEWGVRPTVPHRPLADTLNATKTRDSVFVAVKINSGTRNLTASRAAVASARATKATTDSIRRVADSLLAYALLRDSSASAWKATALAYKRTADSLTRALDTALKAQAKAEAAAVDFKFANDTLLRRNRQLETLKAGYEADMKKMEPKCSIGPLRCPPRKVVGVVGFVIGVFAK